jgi:Nuclease-related domain
MQKSLRKSPLKDKPLRNPGQSVQQEIEKVYDSEFLEPLVLMVITLCMAFTAWLQYFLKAPPLVMATISTLFFLGSSLYFLRKFRIGKKKISNLKLARDGEKTIAEYLEELRADGCHILHDLPGKNFNIDHIIVSARGIFAVETKTRSKSTEKDEVIVFNGQTIKIGDFETFEITKQAEAERVSLKKIIEEATGKTLPVKSIVTFPGWFVKTTGRDKNGSLFVFNPNYFATFVKKQPKTLSDDEVKQVVSQLEKYIRNFTI